MFDFVLMHEIELLGVLIGYGSLQFPLRSAFYKLFLCQVLSGCDLDKLLDRSDLTWSAEAPTTNKKKVSEQGWKFSSCCHCQEFGQQASWLLIGCTRVNNQSEARSAS